ncbi:hypothetical protein ABKN59_000202 [Abortiporus biennis]
MIIYSEPCSASWACPSAPAIMCTSFDTRTSTFSRQRMLLGITLFVPIQKYFPFFACLPASSARIKSTHPRDLKRQWDLCYQFVSYA